MGGYVSLAGLSETSSNLGGYICTDIDNQCEFYIIQTDKITKLLAACKLRKSSSDIRLRLVSRILGSP